MGPACRRFGALDGHRSCGATVVPAKLNLLNPCGRVPPGARVRKYLCCPGFAQIRKGSPRSGVSGLVVVLPKQFYHRDLLEHLSLQPFPNPAEFMPGPES